MKEAGSLSEFDELQNILKETDALEVPAGQDFYDRLHDKIMAEINKIDAEPAAERPTPRPWLRPYWRSWRPFSASKSER